MSCWNYHCLRSCHGSPHEPCDCDVWERWVQECSHMNGKVCDACMEPHPPRAHDTEVANTIIIIVVTLVLSYQSFHDITRDRSKIFNEWLPFTLLYVFTTSVSWYYIYRYVLSIQLFSVIAMKNVYGQF